MKNILKKNTLTKKLLILLSIILIVSSLSGCKSADSKVSATNYCFNTAITITIYNSAGETSAKDIIDECFGLCQHYESLLSRTVDDSDISKINNSNGSPVEVNQIVADIIENSLEYSEMSNGAFDITIAPLTSLWNINENTGFIPSEKEIKKTLKHIDYNTISVLEDKVTLSDKKTEIDLGGIAKGFVADKLKSFMISEGVTSAIIDLGGNILTIGGKSDEEGFNIGIKKPFSKNATDYAATIKITDKSVVTSGIYERYFEKEGKIYHHILDTKTGYPVENNLYSVTIISDNSEEGDALSTTAFALGLQDGKKLINSLEHTEAIFITNKNKVILTKGLNINDNNEIRFKK